MKNHIYLFLLLFLAHLSCEPLEEIYHKRDKLFVGYSKEISYFLTEDDYATIADLVMKIYPGDSVDAFFIAGNKYFADLTAATKYIPAFLAFKYPVLGKSSVADITYDYFTGYPEYLFDFIAPETYNVTEDNYESVGEIQGIYKTFVGTDYPDGYITRFLKDTIESPAKNQIYLVFYNYAEQITDPSETATLTSDDLKILVDHVRDDINFDYVNSWGDAEFYYGADSYFGNFDLRLSQRINFNVEGFDGLSDEQAEQLIRDRLQEGIIYILQKKFPGAVPIVGNDTVYFNISYTTFEGSLHEYYAVYKCASTGPPPRFELVAGPMEEYLNYSNTIKTEKGEYYRFDGSEWIFLPGVYYLSSEDYDEMGDPGIHDYFTDDHPPANYLPQFLSLKYPYAQPDTKIAIAYKMDLFGFTHVLADEYQFNDKWTDYNPSSLQIARFVHNGNKWIFSVP